MKGLFGINIISLIICIFAFSKAFFIGVMIVNILLSYTLIVMTKMGDKFINQYKKMLGVRNG